MPTPNLPDFLAALERRVRMVERRNNDDTVARTGTGPIYLEAILQNGNAKVANDVMPPGMRIPADTTLVSATLRAGVAPTGASLTVVAIFGTTVVATMVLVADATEVTKALSLPVAKGTVIHFNITTVGSTQTGGNLAFALEGT